MKTTTLITSFLMFGLGLARPGVQAADDVLEASVTGTSPSFTYDATQTVPVETVTAAGNIVQNPQDPKVTPDPKKLGYVCTDVELDGHSAIIPFPTVNPSNVGNVVPVTAPTSTYTSDITIVATIAPLQRLVKKQAEDPVEDVPVPVEGENGFFDPEELEELVKRQNVANIFTPISTTYPPMELTRRRTHPVAPLGIVDTGVPLHTNKFYSNLFLGSRNAPVFTMPYEVWWSNQAGDPWGLSIDHREIESVNYGPTQPGTGAAEYYINPIWRRSIAMGATQFSRAKSTMETKNLVASGMSIDATFYADKSLYATSTKKLEVTMCQGMGFVSGTYYALTPVFDSSILFRTLTKQAVFRTGAVKYKVLLEDGSVWLIYGWTAAGTSTPLTLELVNNARIEATKGFSGLVQIAKLSKTAAGNIAAETVYDAATGSFCGGVTLAGSTSGSTGKYSFTYTKKGPGISEVLMFAFPHHRKSFDALTTLKVLSAIKLRSPTKGEMVGVLSNTWGLTETSMPTNIGWLPVKSGTAATVTAANLARIQSAATSEVGQDIVALSTDPEGRLYFEGKPLAKYAYICLTASDVLNNRALALTCLAKLKTAFARFTQNKQRYPLVYEASVWRGMVSDAVYQTGDPYSDFGSGFYNDHHFHYAYFIQTAAILGYLDKKLSNGAWVAANKVWVNLLVRDVANPSSQDTYFPVFRSFDWFHGHSWAKGLFESTDGKDEESSSEDYNFAYAMKLWGKTSGDAAMEARGNLMLAIMKRSLNEYMLIASSNTNHPAPFAGNKLTGIMWENKVHHTTYFGSKIEYIHGVHMLPLTPMSPYIRSAAYCTEEWDTHFAGKTSGILDGWRGILYANVALFKPVSSFNFFKDSGFKSAWLDGGASKTWGLAFAAALGGAAA